MGMYFKNLGSAFEAQFADERHRFAEHLGPFKAWAEERGWRIAEGREPCELLLRRDADPDVVVNFSGRYDGRQDLVMRLKLPRAVVDEHESAVRVAMATLAPAVAWHLTHHKEDSFIALSTRRGAWIGQLAEREAVEERLAAFAQATLPAIEAALAARRA